MLKRSKNTIGASTFPAVHQVPLRFRLRSLGERPRKWNHRFPPEVPSGTRFHRIDGSCVKILLLAVFLLHGSHKTHDEGRAGDGCVEI